MNDEGELDAADIGTIGSLITTLRVVEDAVKRLIPRINPECYSEAVELLRHVTDGLKDLDPLVDVSGEICRTRMQVAAIQREALDCADPTARDMKMDELAHQRARLGELLERRRRS